MTFYSLVLFVHVTAVLAMFATLTFEVLSLFHLRRASTVAEVRLWIDPVPGLPLVAMSSLVAILVSGIYLTIHLSAGGEAWPKVTMATLFVVAPIAAITGRRTRALRRRCATATAMDEDLQVRLQAPVLKVSLGVRIAMVLGIVLLMGAKPELWESVSVVGGALVLGLLSSLVGWGRGTPLPAPSVRQG